MAEIEVESVEAEAAAVADELRTALTMGQAAKELRRSVQALYIDVQKGRPRTLRVGAKRFVPRCGQGHRSLGSRKFKKAAAA